MERRGKDAEKAGLGCGSHTHTQLRQPAWTAVRVANTAAAQPCSCNNPPALPTAQPSGPVDAVVAELVHAGERDRLV